MVTRFSSVSASSSGTVRPFDFASRAWLRDSADLMASSMVSQSGMTLNGWEPSSAV